MHKGPNFSTSSSTLVIFYFIIVILVSVKWYLIEVFIYISLGLMMLSIFSCIWWPFVYLLWRYVYSNPLPFNSVIWILIKLYKLFMYLDTSPLWDMIANNFSHFVGCLFIYWLLPLLCRGFLVWHSLHLFSFLLLHLLLVLIQKKKKSPRPMSRSLSSVSFF